MTTNLNSETDRVAYDPATETYRGEYDWEGSERVCLTVVEIVSAVVGRDHDEMEPLYSVLDPDALERLLSTTRTDLRLSFSYEGCTVTLDSGGEITVEPEG